MGVDVGSLWEQFPFGETAALLLLTTAYATAFHFVAVRRLHGTSGVHTRSLVFAGGSGFAAIAVLLQAAVLAYVGQPPTGLELILLAIGFLAMGLAGSGLSVRWLHRRRTTAPEMQRGTQRLSRSMPAGRENSRWRGRGTAGGTCGERSQT